MKGGPDLCAVWERLQTDRSHRQPRALADSQAPALDFLTAVGSMRPRGTGSSSEFVFSAGRRGDPMPDVNRVSVFGL